MLSEGTGGSRQNTGPEGQAPEISADEYLKAARRHLRDDRLKEAYSIVLRAANVYPDHPLILSYYGWLQAAVDKKARSGVTFCRRAFENFKTADRRIAAAVYPVLYLNLGRALLLAGRKREAVESFGKGLAYDRSHRELKKEMSALGTRKPPVLSFLPRSNPLNMLLGKLLRGKDRS